MCDIGTLDTRDWSWSEVGDRVAEARRVRGLSQERLAEFLELERTAIAKIESGRRQINALELVRLGERLGRPPSWFVAPPPTAVVSRRAATAEQRTNRAGEFALADAIRDLHTLIDARTVKPRATGERLDAFDTDDPRAVRSTAARARVLLETDDSSPLVDLADLVERIGLYAWSFPLGPDAPDGTYRAHEEMEATGVAVINSTLDAGRRRSTLAHELGHHLLGDAHSADWNGDTADHERAIDAFAAALLLPPKAAIRWEALRQERDVRPSAIMIAAEYRVSWSTALRQLRSFELISPIEFRQLDERSPIRADYLECGIRVTEELDGIHVPKGVKAAAVRAYRTHKISASRAVEIIRDDSLGPEDLGTQDSVPIEALWGEITTGLA